VRRGQRRAWGLGLAALTACGGDAPRSAAADAETARVPAPATVGTDAFGAPCVLADRWVPCLLEKRLENSGLVPQLEDSAATLQVFDIPVRRYALGRGMLYAAFFSDSAARRAAVARLDRAAVTRPGAMVPWPEPPLLFESDNLAVVLVTTSDFAARRVEDIVTAGPPQLERR
jgi:hypothetical protein